MKYGITTICVVCKNRKSPIGRSVPLGMYLCDSDCPGYREKPYPGSLWLGESEEDFGYSIGPDGWEDR